MLATTISLRRLTRRAPSRAVARRRPGDQGPRPRHEPFAIRPMETADVPAVIAIMSPIHDVALLPWEDVGLLSDHLRQPNTDNYVAVAAGNVVGAIIGGSFGVRATISHIAVQDAYRCKGVGAALVRAELAAFRRRGLQRVFLFVSDSNLAAHQLWIHCGFGETLREMTWELDI